MEDRHPASWHPLVSKAMSDSEFLFPPPPPPPPKRDFIPGADSGGYSNGHRNGSFSGGNDRGGGFRGRGRGLGRGNGGFRGDSFLHPRGSRNNSSGETVLNSGFIGHREWNQSYSNHGTPGHRVAPSNYGVQQGHSDAWSRSPSSGTNHLNQAQKRDHATAFNHRGRGGSKPPAAPAVPSFLANIPGLSAPTTSTIAQVGTNSPVEKKPKARTSNILGLNPSIQEPESDGDDEDEEAKLAATTSSTGVAFEYGGRVATLKTPDEIAAWIADRKKRFPTAAKAAQAQEEKQEKQRKWEEEKKANQEARRLQRESYEKERMAKLQEPTRSRKVAMEVVQTSSGTADRASDATAKARMKTDKLIKKAEKAQMKLKKAQDALRKAQGAAVSATAAEFTSGGSEEQVIADVEKTQANCNDLVGGEPKSVLPSHEDLDASSALTPSDSENGDEDTSSSGSSADSSSDSESESVPEVLTTKRTAPERVPPPPRSAASASTRLTPCRNMVKFGKCNSGKKCRFSHDPDLVQEVVIQNGSNPKGKQRENQTTGRPKRKGLWEIMVEKEKEEEARTVLKVIVEMGEKGMLEGGD